MASSTTSNLGRVVQSPLQKPRDRPPRLARISLRASVDSHTSPAAPPESMSASLVPRRCTLRELTFSDDGRLITRSPAPPGTRSSELIELFLATVEASAQVKDLETLTGRLSMVAFFLAIAVESTTGSGVFSTVDQVGLQKAVGLGLLSAVGAGAFAVAMRGKRNVTDILSRGCQRLMDSTVDSLVDALFFQECSVPHCTQDDKRSGN